MTNKWKFYQYGSQRHKKFSKMINDYSLKYKEQVKLLEKNLDKIKKHDSTKKIEYSDYKRSFDYISYLYPSVDIKKANIYKCDSSYLSYVGYKGIGGFFEKVNKTIIIGDGLINSNNLKKYDCVAEISIDEILVHELLHYVHFDIGCNINSVELSEEFAYGNSIKYLKSNGRTNDDIINKNFLPFLITTVNVSKIYKNLISLEGYSFLDYKNLSKYKKDKINNKINKDLNEMILKQAKERGQKIIDIYSKEESLNIIDNSENKNVNNFTFLDI